MARAVGRIEHNDYLYNQDGAIYIHNDDDFTLEIQHVDLTIFENRFKHNHGSFVLNLGLSHYDYLSTQSLYMNFNWVQENVIAGLVTNTSFILFTSSTHYASGL